MKLQIISQDVVAPGVYRMSLEYPAQDRAVVPGQFFMLKVSDEIDPLLRRPLSVHEIDTSRSVPHLKFLYQVVGKGTTILSELGPGAEIDVMGPLGKGFSLAPGTEEALLVAGGIGVAPYLELAKIIENTDCRILAFIGGKTAADILTMDELARSGVEVHAVTEDGSLGARGLVTDALEGYLSKAAGRKRAIFACGPWGMMRRMAELGRCYDIPTQLSLDQAMACGVGACRGCVVQVINTAAAEGFSYKTVCKDGPVFGAETLFFQP